MEFSHDLMQQTGYLLQCLIQDKRCIGLFLGAGCPQGVRLDDGSEGPLIPDLMGLTREVCDRISQGGDCQNALSSVLTQLQTGEGDPPSLEGILDYVRALSAVAAVGTDPVRGLSRDLLELLDRKVCDLIVDTMKVPLPRGRTPYHQLATWIGAVDRAYPVEVFTTNYDLLLEQALEESRVPYFDGFVGSRRAFFDPHAIDTDRLPPRWARVWKLHGSINWYQSQQDGVFRGGISEEGQLRVIHPSHLKYAESRRMPYLAMLDRLRAFLRQGSAVLIICGYSFRDQHLNEVIVQGLEENPTAVAFGLLFGNISEYQQAATIAQKRSNLTLLANDAAVIGTRQGPWQSSQDQDSAMSAPGVESSDSPEAAENPVERERHTLGDFGNLGDFLELVVGVRHKPEAKPNED